MRSVGLILPARVIEVTDGDTVVVEFRRELRIRLLDCWAPEPCTQEGLDAKNHLQRLIDGKEVTVEIPIEPDGRFGDKMSFNRILGRLVIDGQDVSELMVQEGHATQERPTCDS